MKSPEMQECQFENVKVHDYMYQKVLKKEVGPKDTKDNTQCPRTDLSKRFLPK